MAVNRLPDPNGGIQPSTLTTTGDILYASSAQVAARLAIGSANQALGVSGGIPAYQASSKSTLTTTGDIIYASAANTPARLGIGSTGQLLTVASGIPSWATAAVSYVGVAAIANNTTIAVVANTALALPMATANQWDTNSFHSTSVNNTRITIPTSYGGKYLITAQIQNNNTCNYAFLYFMKNGSNTGMPTGTPGAFYARVQGNASNSFGLYTSTVVALSAADYIELGYQSDATNAATLFDIRFTATYLGA